MKKFHINKDGNVMSCTAKIRECPFPSSDHYLNKEIAVKESERRLAKMNKTVPSLRKSTSGTAQLEDNGADHAHQRKSLEQSIADEAYTDENIEASLLRRFEKYKTDTTITGHLDKVLYSVRTGKNKSKALTALSNNPNISEYDLMRIVAIGSPENKEVLEQTKNERLIQMALADEAYVDTRHSTLRNPLSTVDDLYNVSMLHPKNHYKKSWKSSLTKNGYSTDHIGYAGANKQAPDNLKEAQALKKMALTMLERNDGVKSADEIEAFTQKIINSSGYEKMAYSLSNNSSSLLKNKQDAAKFAELVIRTQFYKEKLEKTRELVKTRRHNSGAYGRVIPREQYATPEKNTPEAKPAVSPDKADISKLDKFKNKNTVSMASYEQSTELQKRWKDGIDELPLEMRKNVLNKRFNNTQEGLRGVVDLFKTSDTEGQMVKSGLNNFVNHVNNMREQEKKKGYIAVDNPEFITPAGLVKVEEHVGNYDYGEKMTFRVNGEKFEMSKPMQSDKWATFIHIKENSGTELEKSETKKGFWGRLFS